MMAFYFRVYFRVYLRVYLRVYRVKVGPISTLKLLMFSGE